MQQEAKSRTSGKLGTLFGFITLILLFATLASSLLRQSVVFWLFLGLEVVSLAIFVTLKRQDVLDFFVSRQARYGANVGVSALLVIGIAIIVNVVVAQRLDKTADWTADKLYTLSDQTKKILHGLKKEVQVTAFFSVNSADDRLARNYRLAKELLERYQRETDKLHVEFVDPYADAQRSKAYDIQFDGTTVFESGSRRESVTTVDEQKFTSAIMKVVRDEVKKIDFLAGHGERELDDFERKGYSDAKAELEKQNYQIETLNLATQPGVPSDCAALIIAGPQAPLTPHEIDAIDAYLDKNGKLFLMLDPSMQSAEDPNSGLVNLMDRWGVKVGNDLVIDRIHPAFFAFGSSYPEAPTLSRLEFHQITQYVDKQVTFQLARSITPKPNPGGDVTVKSLVKTSDDIGGSWGETERQADGTFVTDPSYTAGEDTPPPVSLAVAVQLEAGESAAGDEPLADQPKETKTRIVVVGDSDFSSNFFFKGTGGGDLFLNAVNWLTLEADLIAIRPINPNERSLRMMTPGEAALVQMAAIFLIPVIIFMVGVGVWWQRR